MSSSDQAYPNIDIWAAGESERESSGFSDRLADASLMTLVQSGDEKALGQLLERYARLILNIGLRILRDPGEAQELVQDVFFHVYKKCHLFDPQRGTFRGWLIRLASNRAFDRREYLNLHRFYDDRNIDDFVEVIQSSVDVEYQLQVTQGEAAIRAAFEELTPKQRKTLELYFFEGYTLREVSSQTNESLANTRHYYYRALEKLKASLGKQQGESK